MKWVPPPVPPRLPIFLPRGEKGRREIYGAGYIISLKSVLFIGGAIAAFLLLLCFL